MKELSMEEKSKRYDKVLDEAKAIHKVIRKDLKPVIEQIFPELKEPEDERIRKALMTFFQGFPYDNPENTGNLENAGTNAKEVLAWLEKQGNNADEVKQQQAIEIPFGAKDSELQEATYHIPDGYHAEINGNEVVIKKGEQKSINTDFKAKDCYVSKVDGKIHIVGKFEPKFKVGDFIANDYCRGKIVELTNDAYLLDTGQGIPFSCEHNIHLWTIEDAKDGDVLVASDDSIFIYKNQRDNGVVHYIAVTPCNDLEINENDYSWESKNACHPATKDEQTILFARMEEAGYEWNEDKKELIKL